MNSISSMQLSANYGWVSVCPGVELPFVTRSGNAKYIPVKLVDILLLRHYPSSYPTQLADKPPLICQFLSSAEAKILSVLCEQKYHTSNLVCTLDPIVNLTEFQLFFHIVQQTYPDVHIPEYRIENGQLCVNPSPDGTASGERESHPLLPKDAVTPGLKSVAKEPVPHGWLLVREAMVPYIERMEQVLLPLNVLQGAARLLVGVEIPTIPSRDIEVDCLNYMCKLARMTFEFEKGTPLVELVTLVMVHPTIPMRKLPSGNPLAGLVSGLAAPLAVPTSTTPVAPPPAVSGKYKLPSPPPLIPLDKMFPQHEDGRESPEEVMLEDAIAMSAPRSSRRATMSPQAESTRQTFPRSKIARRHSAPKRFSNIPYTMVSRNVVEAVEPVKIKTLECFGKPISCITRGKLKTKYTLVESMCRLFFPDADMVEFVRYLEHDLSVILYSLKKAEEAAFIEFFGIPTDKLCCNLLIKLKDFVDRMAWLQEHFHGKGALSGTSDDSKISLGKFKRGSKPNRVHTFVRDTNRSVEAN